MDHDDHASSDASETVHVLESFFFFFFKEMIMVLCLGRSSLGCEGLGWAHALFWVLSPAYDRTDNGPWAFTNSQEGNL